MTRIKVNEQFNFELAEVNGEISLSGSPLALDVIRLSNGAFHFLYKHKSYNAEVVSHDAESKLLEVKVNGKIYRVAVEDQFDILLKEMGLTAGKGKKALEVKAPMPGLVLSVNVTEGQKVGINDNLVVLEAMKMENMLKSATEGVVKKVLVAKGDKVEKNQVLIAFE